MAKKKTPQKASATKTSAKKKSSKKKAAKPKKQVANLVHEEAARRNIPTAELQSVMNEVDRGPVPVTYPRGGAGGQTPLADEKAARNPDLDPQLVWRGKDAQDQQDLVVQAPPLFIQEKVHPKVLIDDLRRQTEAAEIAKKIATGDHDKPEDQLDLFADFNGLPEHADARTEFYQHDQHWSNRMILGDSLAVMGSLAEREGLRGKVQCIYLDPPYGIKFNSNFQWSTTSRDVKDGNAGHITREPEMVKAFRDTWRDGIHSYLTYLRDRLTVARDLLHESGSIFVQIGDENVHRVRAVMDEVFGDGNFVAQITFRVKSPLKVSDLARTTDFILWYAKSKLPMKFRQARVGKDLSRHPEFSMGIRANGEAASRTTLSKTKDVDARFFTAQNLGSSGYTKSCMYDASVEGRSFSCPKGKSWKTHPDGMVRLGKANRLQPLKTSLRWRYFFDDAPSEVISDIWQDTFAASDKTYVVQTSELAIQRCILMCTDPGDLVLDPTCGSGTTAYVAEQWGRRWITIDTSRVSLALARARIMGARYPFYLLADSPEGQAKEAEVTRREPASAPTRGNVRHGFVYERVPHITLKSIANNAEIDVIWDDFQTRLEPLREQLNAAVDASWEEWEIPREAEDDWPEAATRAHADWWEQRIARQQEIDASIAAKADFEYLYDKPYEDKKKIRVAGPFTVESLSPHRTLGVGADDELIDPAQAPARQETPSENDFAHLILENLKTAGVQQADKAGKIDFVSLNPWPGRFICAEGLYEEREGAKPKRAGIFIGPEFGTVTRQNLVEAAREAGDAGFDVVIACAFNYEAHATEMNKLGAIRVLKARMNADLHMAEDLKNTGKGNLFVIFGEPDIDILGPIDAGDDPVDPVRYETLRVRINGVDVFHPATGEVRSDNADGIACWFIDTDYNDESFFVRHAYFLGANDPYKALKTTLKAEIDAEAWESLNRDISREFPRPKSGKIAVKVINHLGDEVMKVFRVE